MVCSLKSQRFVAYISPALERHKKTPEPIEDSEVLSSTDKN